ncbi:MAG: hypothetical protein IIA88_03890 [Bacteroidetes bacterium]|nr:hypothetical protein [Bacteroidota bacterium]
MKSISKITIPKNITNGEELLVIRKQEYDYLLKHLTEIQDAFMKISKGDHEFKKGNTIVVKSLKELRS